MKTLFDDLLTDNFFRDDFCHECPQCGMTIENGLRATINHELEFHIAQVNFNLAERQKFIEINLDALKKIFIS